MRIAELAVLSQEAATDALPEPIDAVSCRRQPCDMAPMCEEEGICLARRSLTEVEVGAALGNTCFIATLEPNSQN